MRKLGVILLCAVLAVLAWRASRTVPQPLEVQHPWTSASDPFAPAALRARMERLAPLVSEVVGYSIDVARLRIAATDDRLAAERQFARKFPQWLDSSSDDFSAEAVFRVAVMRAQWASSLGVYRSETSSIELFPVHFDSFVPDRIDAVLDIVVAHELAHAWQDQQFGVQADKPRPRKREASFAWNAVIEGSAEFVAKRVANQLGIGATFERMAAERGGESASFPVARRSWYFFFWAYREGLKFVEAVNVERKSAPDWEGLFRNPPRAVFSIERPREWFDRAHPVAEPLDDWAERFSWCVEGEPSKLPFDREWRYWPITPSGLQDRLALAELAGDDPAWSDCRGGLIVVGTPARGGLAGADTEIRIWRLGSPAQARAARATLEQAAAGRGARAWSRDAFVEYSGATRRRTGAGGATVYSQTGMDREIGQVEEAICALDVQGSFLLEAVAARVGAAPALLELLETMQQAFTDAGAIDRARAGSTERPWGALADLRSAGGVGAFLAALVPAAGDDPWSATERGGAIVAALSHKDADVRRFALGSLGRGDLKVRPFALEVVSLIRAASRDPQADVRALAIHASDALASERVLGRERIDLLLSDRSPLVRASLASSPGMLMAGDIELLRADDSGMVRRAVGSSRARSRRGFSPSFPRWMRWTRNPETDMQRAGDLEFLWSMTWDDVSGEQRAAQLARLRNLLGSRDDSIRMSAIVSVVNVEGDRSTLVPSLLDAFAGGPYRRAATVVLLEGNFDLEPFRSRLMRMLENPFCKVEVLRVIAANNLELTPATRGEILPWLKSDNAALACSAALALLDDGAAEDALAAHWSSVHLELRSQIIRAVLRRDPDSSFATRLRTRALASPYSEEREAVFDSIEADRDCPAHWEALLQRISEGGSEVAGECWRDFARRVRKLAASRPDAIVDRFIRHLNDWCDRGELPRLSWRERKIYSWDLDEWPKSSALAVALDRCILRSDAPSTRLVFALVREAITSGEIPPPVRAEMEKLFSAPASPDTPVAGEIHEAVAHRSVFGVETVCAVLRRRADSPWSKFIFPRSLRSLLGDDDRQRAARALVPEFLRSGGRRHVAVALEILEELENANAAELAQLREWAARALPSWREKLESSIRRLDLIE